jgi:hypothetical protein
MPSPMGVPAQSPANEERTYTQKLFRKQISCQKLHPFSKPLRIDGDGCPSSGETSQ